MREQAARIVVGAVLVAGLALLVSSRRGSATEVIGQAPVVQASAGEGLPASLVALEDERWRVAVERSSPLEAAVRPSEPQVRGEPDAKAAELAALRATFLGMSPDIQGMNRLLAELALSAEVIRVRGEGTDRVEGVLSFEGTELEAKFSIDGSGNSSVRFHEIYRDGDDPDSENYPWDYSMVRVMFNVNSVADRPAAGPDSIAAGMRYVAPRILVHHEGPDSRLRQSDAMDLDPQGNPLRGWFCKLGPDGYAKLAPHDYGPADSATPILPFSVYAGPDDAHKLFFAKIAQFAPGQ